MFSLTVLAAVLSMTGVTGRVASSAVPCLEYKACYREVYLHHSRMEIHFYDHENSTASSCLPVCLEERPTTQLVMTKIIEMNERLVCGCGDKEAMGSSKGTTEDHFGCEPCPGKLEKCGGEATVSIYRVERSGKCRKGLHPDPQTESKTTSATTTTTTTATTTPGLVMESSSEVKFLGYVELEPGERGAIRASLQLRVGREAERCLATCLKRDPRQRYGFLRPEGNAVLCGCGSQDFVSGLARPVTLAPTNAQPFGNVNTFIMCTAGSAPGSLLHSGLSLLAAVVTVVAAARF